MVVHFIGAGPGAADLLTLRAAALLGRSRTCLYPGTYLDEGVLSHCPDGAVLIDTAPLDLDQITAHLRRAHDAGHDIARLCSGDPSLYSALAEQTSRLDRLSIPWDVTPGVPAYAAAAATIGRELTVPELVQSVVLTRAQARSTKMPASEDLANFARTRATLVLHLAIRHAAHVADVASAEYGPDCPAVVVYRASQPGQLVIRTTLAGLAADVERSGLRQAAVILIGPALGQIADCRESHLYDPARSRP